MSGLAKISLLLVLLLVSLSAYLRLAHSGIGCADWPECYGRIGQATSVSQDTESMNPYQKMVEQANEPLAWAAPLHRLVASILGLLNAALAFIALRRKKQRITALALLGLTAFLAVLGVRSGNLHSPAVVMGNLAGGFCMLGLLAWMVFSPGSKARAQLQTKTRRVRRMTLLAIIVLSVQIALGGLTSASFAATSCQTLPDCHGKWLPGSALLTAFDLSRRHEITSAGQAIGGAERPAIHQAHRIVAVVTLAVIVLTALVALRSGASHRKTAIFLLALVTLEFSVGVAAILSSLPIGLAVAHNWLAGLLLLTLVRQAALSTTVRNPDG